MRDKKDWTKPLTPDDDLCAECGDTSKCPPDPGRDEPRIEQSIEIEGYDICLTCPNYTMSTAYTKT